MRADEKQAEVHTASKQNKNHARTQVRIKKTKTLHILTLLHNKSNTNSKQTGEKRWHKLKHTTYTHTDNTFKISQLILPVTAAAAAFPATTAQSTAQEPRRAPVISAAFSLRRRGGSFQHYYDKPAGSGGGLGRFS